jgi:hypothetical protein
VQARRRRRRRGKRESGKREASEAEEAPLLIVLIGTMSPLLLPAAISLCFPALSTELDGQCEGP